MEIVAGKAMTVVGGARSGRAVARLLAQAGAEVFLTEHGAATEGLVETLEQAGVRYEVGGHTAEALEADALVLSPGVPTQSDLVQHALRDGLPVYSEIEVASWFCRAPIVAITGTNGKTTTTSLTGHVFRRAFAAEDTAQDGRRVIVAGNIGYPISDYVLDARPQDVVVMEVSSFQLDHVHTFRPRVSVLLNITPDHLDRYDHSLNDYAQSKFRIFARQGAGDVLVYNHDDALVRAYVAYAAPRRGVRTLGLSVKGPLPRAASDAAVPAGGAYLCDDVLYLHLDANAAPDALMPADEVALRGTHNLYNALAAAVAARTMEVARDAVREGLARFEGVPHRLETVRTVGGVRYVNDSKATNVRAVWYALGSFRAPVVLIAGGRDKGNDYGPLKPLVRAHVRAVVALGESAETVLRDLGAEAPASVHATSMDDALRHARRLAAPGDVVLLSPACSSFDMFEHYEDRGDTFKRLVQAL